MLFPRAVRFPGPLDKGNEGSGDEIEKVGEDLGGESRRRESKGTYECCAA